MVATLSLLTIALVSPSPPTQEGKLDANQRIDLENLCGSYCVARVLHLYHKETEFLTLATELQGPKLDHKASLSQLAVALRQRGIHARLARLSPLEIPVGEHPVILHTNGNHFIVLERLEGSFGYVWDGGLPLQKIPWWKIKITSSAICLLTSHDPIDENPPSVFRGYRYAGIGIGVVLVFFGLVLFLRRRPSAVVQGKAKFVPVGYSQEDSP